MRLLQISNVPNEETISLLKDSVIGTPGSGMLYQHKTVENRISHIKSPFFVSLRSKLTLIGTCCFCFRVTLNQNRPLKSFYIRFFSFREQYRAKRLNGKQRKPGQLRQEINSLLQGEQLNVDRSSKYFNYAYVDPRNVRSALLCNEFGFQEVRRFSTFIFSRINPTTPSGLIASEVDENQFDEIRKLLLEKYSGFNMVPFEERFLATKYYVVRNPSGKIMAGAQVLPGHWRIYKMNNATNSILLSVASYVPLLRRLLNREFKFLAVDSLYFTEDGERYTEALLSSLLKTLNHYNALIPADSDTSLARHLQKLKLGIVSKISHQVPTSVICRFNNFSSAEIEQFQKTPAYVSALDVT